MSKKIPVRPNPIQGSLSYCLVFRSGQIEAVFIGSRDNKQSGDKPFIPSRAYEEETIKAVQNYLGALKSLEIPCPLAIFISLTGVLGVTLSIDSFMYRSIPNPIDRDTLILPDVIVQDYTLASEFNLLARILRPTFDSVWNACGYQNSMNFNTNGDWNQKG